MTEERIPATRPEPRPRPAGAREAAPDLLPVLYEELRRLAGAHMRRLPPGQTLQATALVHEAYMRLVRGGDPSWDGKAHFFGAAARAIREILIERARRKAALKRGGGRRREALAPEDLPLEAPTEDLLALNEVLPRLNVDAPRAHEVVMLRYFAGLSLDEVAELLGVSTRTAERDWRYARAWLHERLQPDEGARRES